MNKPLKQILIVGTSLLLLSSTSAGVNRSVNGSHLTGWRRINHSIDLKMHHKRLYLHRGAYVYVMAYHHNKAHIKVDHGYFNIGKRFLKKHFRSKKSKLDKESNISTTSLKSSDKVNHSVKSDNSSNKTNVPLYHGLTAQQVYQKFNHEIPVSAHFQRSNSYKKLFKSGYVDFTGYGPSFMSRYSPSDPRAVVPKYLNLTKYNWMQGNDPDNFNNITNYQYNERLGTWVKMPPNFNQTGDAL